MGRGNAVGYTTPGVTCTGFNEAATHGSRKSGDVKKVADDFVASMRPRLMGRGNGVGVKASVTNFEGFNEAATHGSRKSSHGISSAAICVA